jgi:hypothetical protein
VIYQLLCLKMQSRLEFRHSLCFGRFTMHHEYLPHALRPLRLFQNPHAADTYLQIDTSQTTPLANENGPRPGCSQMESLFPEVPGIRPGAVHRLSDRRFKCDRPQLHII